MVASIAMYGQRKFKGYAPSLTMRNVDRAAGKEVTGQGTCIDVVGIVVLSASGTIDAEWHTCPLTVVTSAFQTTRQLADIAATLNVSHSATEAHSIGRDHTVTVMALVGQRHTVPLVAALVEIEGTQVNPRGAAHLLVDTELSLLSLMPYGVVSIVDTAINGLIAHIDSVTASFGNSRLVGNHAVFRLAGGSLSHACRSCLKRILTVGIVPTVHSETL